MRNTLRVLAALVLALVVCSCAGYRAASDREAPLKLPEQFRDLYLRSVDNPTMEPGLEAQLRSALRDELTRRARVLWVDRERATAYVDLTVHQFTSQTSLTGADDETIKSTASIELSAAIVRRSDGSRIWSADHVSYGQTYSGDARSQAEQAVLDIAVRRLVDRMGQAY